MKNLVTLCKRRGILFQSSEIYGGLNGFWDYGPLGVEIKRNVKEAWWHDMVQSHNEMVLMPGAPSKFEMVGLDCSIIMHPQVWKCSGHYDLFHDFIISDYYVAKSLIFSKNNLQDDEYQLFSRFFNIIFSDMPKPELLVYVYSDVARLQQNIHKRGRSYEQEISDA